MSEFNNYRPATPFSSSFTVMKMRYNELDKHIIEKEFAKGDDTCNVFINFECVMNNITGIKDIENKLLLERNFATILESEALNLCAHYKKFFLYNQVPCRIFLYYTDLNSNQYADYKYNEDFRSYYTNKFIYNPKYQMLGRHMQNSIIPRIQKIMEFIPDVHFIIAQNFEGSLIPDIIASSDPKVKNFVITGDRYETQYMLRPNFMVHYIKYWPGGYMVYYDFPKYLKDDIFREEEEDTQREIINLLEHPALYTSLLAIRGNKPRSIDPIKGYGMKTIMKCIKEGITDGKITEETSSPQMLKDILDDDKRDDFVSNFLCTDLFSQRSEVTRSMVSAVMNQISNRSDLNSLVELNRTTYVDYPLQLEELTGKIVK